MNFWNFAMAHPYATTFIGAAVVASGLGVGVSFARNKTPIIGSFSPSFSLNLGKQEETATDMNDIIAKKEEL